MSTTARPPPSPFKVGEAMRALHEARERILAVEPDMQQEDADLWRDMIEGESGDAYEVIERIVSASIDADYMAKMVAERQKDLAERKARFERRKDNFRSVALQLLEIIGTDRLTFPDFTVSIGDRPAKVLITDETKLPFALTRTTIEPMKGLIAAELKAGREVPGATWSNPERGISVRSK